MHDEMGGVVRHPVRPDERDARDSPTRHLRSPYLDTLRLCKPAHRHHRGFHVFGSQIGSLPDGTQIWRIFHNGVDTHTSSTIFPASLVICRVLRTQPSQGDALERALGRDTGSIPVWATTISRLDKFRAASCGRSPLKAASSVPRALPGATRVRLP